MPGGTSSFRRSFGRRMGAVMKAGHGRDPKLSFSSLFTLALPNPSVREFKAQPCPDLHYGTACSCGGARREPQPPPVNWTRG